MQRLPYPIHVLFFILGTIVSLHPVRAAQEVGPSVFLEADQFQITVVDMKKAVVVHMTLAPSDTIKTVKERIMAIEGSPVQEQILSYRGDLLEGDRPLADYELPGKVTLQLSFLLRAFSFSPMSRNAQQNRRFSARAHRWRHIRPGLNLEGQCNSKDCAARSHRAWSMRGFRSDYEAAKEGYFCMDHEVLHTPCPLCGNYLDNVTVCGFYRCYYSFRGTRRRSMTARISRWFGSGDASDYNRDVRGEGVADQVDSFVRFGEDPNLSGGLAVWKSLMIQVVPLEEVLSKKVCSPINHTSDTQKLDSTLEERYNSTKNIVLPY